MKGHKLGKGGKHNPPRGRALPKTKQEGKRIAALARKYFEKELKPILDAYISYATGRKVGKGTQGMDPATVRRIVGRLIPPAGETTLIIIKRPLRNNGK